MTKPLLHLITQGKLNSTDRVALAENMMHNSTNFHGIYKYYDSDKLSRNIIIAIDASQPFDLLSTAISRYPKLAQFGIKFYFAGQQINLNNSVALTPEVNQMLLRDIFDAEISLVNTDVLVYTTSHFQGIETIQEAMNNGVVVLIPDSLPVPDSFIKDGINGFVYRSQNPDSLALSLFALTSVSRETLSRITEQARASICKLLQINSTNHGQEAGG